jgi:F0F1-type ATP synthase assembly protein I
MTYYQITADFSLKKREKNIKTKKQSYFQLANFLNIGYYLVAPLLIGVFLGALIDRSLKTKYGTIIFILLGFLASLYNLFSLTKKATSKK